MADPIASKQIIEQIYNGSATLYDCAGPSIFTRFGMRLVDQIPFVPGMHVLDVATGKGAVLLPVARRVGPSGHVTGIDLSSAMVEETKRIAEAESLKNVELRKMDAEDLQFADQSFDVITCAFALFMLPNMEAAMEGMYRVCKPGGYIGLTLFNNTPPPFNPGWPILSRQFKEYGVGLRMPQHVAFSPEEVDSLLSRSGFRCIQMQIDTNDIIYASEEDWWSFQLTLGSRLTILNMDEETRTKFKNEYLAKLRPTACKDGLHMSLSVIYAVAQR